MFKYFAPLHPIAKLFTTVLYCLTKELVLVLSCLFNDFYLMSNTLAVAEINLYFHLGPKSGSNQLETYNFVYERYHSEIRAEFYDILQLTKVRICFILQ